MRSGCVLIFYFFLFLCSMLGMRGVSLGGGRFGLSDGSVFDVYYKE